MLFFWICKHGLSFAIDEGMIYCAFALIRMVRHVGISGEGHWEIIKWNWIYLWKKHVIRLFQPFTEEVSCIGFRVNFGQISGKFHSGYPKWHLRDSGLSLCETFSLPPRAIIKMKIIGILLTQKPFICFSLAYENEFLTRRRNKKIAQSSVARFGLFVIRLGFEKSQWNTKEYSILLLWFTFYKWLIYK